MMAATLPGGLFEKAQMGCSVTGGFGPPHDDSSKRTLGVGRFGVPLQPGQHRATPGGSFRLGSIRASKRGSFQS